jgi:redox-sensitive bicupin YhaK (pirin superfamily)
MITLRPAEARGHADLGWLKTWYSFSFADYYDPAEMGWGPLRVINDDRIAPGTGFPTHGHRDMEIVTYILDGALAHKDSLGNGSVIQKGEVQRMTAGSGIRHSEETPPGEAATHLLQIWIEPEARGLEPGYEQIFIPDTDKQGRLRLIASRDGRAGSVTIHQQADIYAALLAAGDRVSHALAPGRLAYLQVASGNLRLNGQALTTGDGAKVRDETLLEITGESDAEILLFDLPDINH